MDGNNLNVPPVADEFEVSVFGPGFGECIVIHLGNSEWIVIDCCIDADSQEPVALQYFETLKIDPANAVSLTVATHWHDDHIGGFGRLYETCKAARFACSLALNSTEWCSLVTIYRNYLQAGGSGVDEILRTMEELKRRAKRGEVVAPLFCMARNNIPRRDKGPDATLQCLAPSDAAIVTMQTRIQRELLPKANERRLRVPMLAENDGSVVLGIRVGAASVLLGADLEEKNRRGLGWQVILDGCQPGEPKYGGFKIPHHGSETGHHPSTWPTMMTPDAWAAVTPFNRQKDPLPRKEDCVRILQMTEHAYITAPAGFGRFRHSDSAVQKTMAEAALAIGTELSKQGHIRFRKSCTDSAKAWSTELFGNAVHLREYLAMAK